MAFTWVFIDRNCPEKAFDFLENEVADAVGEVIYGHEYPVDADVDVAIQYAHLATYMALKIEIDTEDLPQPGWIMTESGLCIPEDRASEDEIDGPRLGYSGLTDAQRNKHFGIQGRQIHDRLLCDSILWQPDNPINWREGSKNRRPNHRLGVLVSRAEGAWFATYSDE